MKHVEDMLAAMYSYFSSSPNSNLEFQKLPTCLKSKGNKIQRNVKTRWISMFGPAKKVLEYIPSVMKIAMDAPKESTTNDNLFVPLD